MCSHAPTRTPRARLGHSRFDTTHTLALALALVTGCDGDGVDPSGIDLDGDGESATSDCNDVDPHISSTANESCNGIDDNCDGLIDNAAVDAPIFFQDVDGDGYGDASTTQAACDPPAGFVTDSSDCNDGDSAFHPGATETDCTDENDYNCDGSTGVVDVDGDGYPACQDCNDAVHGANSGQRETCDGLDNDCDGAADEPGAVGEVTWYADADGDGFGNPLDSTTGCDQPEQAVGNAQDCNDSSAAAHPGGVETCDNLDNDCDGDIDDGADDAPTWYADGDSDGFGDPGVALVGCDAPAGFTDSADDCNDDDRAVHPGAREMCDDEDDNCDGVADEGLDADGDGWTICAGDCNDADVDVHPEGVETCNGGDDNCNGLTDEAGATDEPTWYIDYDGDGHGDEAFTFTGCEAPAGFVGSSDDCDDLDAEFNPDASPRCDGRDYDCDGAVDSDGDGDGFADAACGGDDCDDADGSVTPEPGGGCDRGSCNEYVGTVFDRGDGVYTLDPDGVGGESPFEVYCDMSTSNGGWTLVGVWSNEDSRVGQWLALPPGLSVHNDEVWFSGDAFGDCSALGTQDAKCGSYMTVPGDEMLIRERAWNGEIGIARYELTEELTMEEVFRLPPYPSNNNSSDGTSIMISKTLVADPGNTATAFVKNPFLRANYWLGNDGCRLASTTTSQETTSGLGCRVDYTWPGWPLSEDGNVGAGDVNTDNGDTWFYNDSNFGDAPHRQMVVWIFMR